jgi:hypothetical protein
MMHCTVNPAWSDNPEGIVSLQRHNAFSAQAGFFIKLLLAFLNLVRRTDQEIDKMRDACRTAANIDGAAPQKTFDQTMPSLRFHPRPREQQSECGSAMRQLQNRCRCAVRRVA